MESSSRGKLPRFESAKGKLIRVGPFLSGDQHTLFAPRQPHGAAVVDNYTPPTEWPLEGTLLRAPQVVWLTQADLIPLGGDTSFIEGFTKTSYTRDLAYGTDHPDYVPFDLYAFYNTASFRDEFLAGDGTLQTGMFSTFDQTGDPTFYPMGFHLSVTVHSETTYDDPRPAETARLDGVFAAVKSAIESVRAGRTWVEIKKWSNYSLSPFYYGEAIPCFNTTPVLPARGTFFGTSFLHIGLVSAGGFGFDEFGHSGVDFGGQFIPPLFIEGGSGMASFGLRYFSPDSSAWPSVYAETPPEGDPLHDFAGFAGVAAIEAADGEGSNLDLQIGSIVGDELDMTHPGNSSLLTEGYLLGMIRDHFGFNALGKDI